MRASDFQSFQAMQTDSNVTDVEQMINALHAYGPVMMAHYKPDNSSLTTFGNDMRAILTDDFLAHACAQGLIAWSFMDDAVLRTSPATYDFVISAVQRHGVESRANVPITLESAAAPRLSSTMYHRIG